MNPGCKTRLRGTSRLAAALLLAVVISGCATLGYPPLPDFQLDSQSRVGYYMDDLGGSPTHTHVGTTVFTNFTRSYEQLWPLAEHAASALEAEAARHGLVAVDLRDIGLDGEALAQLTTSTSQGWQLAADQADLVARLQQDHQLAAVIVMRSLDRQQVFYVCGYGGCQSTFANGMGVLSRGMFGHLGFHAVPAISMQVHVLQPPVNLARYSPLSNKLHPNSNSVPLNDRVERPADIDTLSDDFLATVRTAIEERIDELIESAFHLLVNPTP